MITEENLADYLADPYWRLENLYSIMTKGGDGKPSKIIFKPNAIQRSIVQDIWYRNITLKARQVGITTLVCIMWLDHALFNADQRCGIIAQDINNATVIFRDKVKFAYDNLPEALKAEFPLARDSQSELLFSHNNSSVRVATSMRSGTIHRLLVSEFGKICAKYPERADEVVTGSFQAVPSDGITIVESTAEGQDGYFYEMTKEAENNAINAKPLSRREFRFFFFPWWQTPEYALDSAHVYIGEEDEKYFAEVESQASTTLSPEQRAWYVSTRKSDFAGDKEKMWQEYPSTSREAFAQSTEGSYYATQLMQARKDGRVTTVPYTPGYPVNTFWDIGNSDGTAIWFHQRIGLRDHLIGFDEGWNEPYSYYVKRMQDRGWVWGKHYLPHDGAHERQGELQNISPQRMLENLGLRDIKIVTQVSELQTGIQKTRDLFGTCWFDEHACEKGIAHLQMYRKRWNEKAGRWSDTPLKDIHTEAADAFRQIAQGYDPDEGNGPSIVFASEWG